MAVKTLKCQDVIIKFPKITFKKRKKDDQHKEEQKQPIHGAGQDRLSGEIETLVREARLHTSNGRQ